MRGDAIEPLAADGEPQDAWQVLQPVKQRRIDDHEVILQGDLAMELGQFVRLGMLAEERPDDARRVYYVRTNSSL